MFTAAHHKAQNPSPKGVLEHCGFAAHTIETEWRAATAAGANNGVLTLWIDGTQQNTFSNIDNDTRRIDYVQLGAVGGIDTNTRGSIYLDAFESRRASYIGLMPGARQAARQPGAPKTAALVPAARPKPRADQLVTTTLAYRYDPLNRLTQANYSDGSYFRYTFDAAGNRLSESTTLATTAYSYDDANRLAAVNGQAYQYDNNGNLLNDGSAVYSYDPANRLSSVTLGGQTTSYLYNGLNNRVGQSVGGLLERYVLDQQSGLVQVLQDGTRSYLYGSGRLAQRSASLTEYYLTDALGSVRQLTDASGAAVLSRSYEPYGKILSAAGAASSPYAFTGERYDPGLGLLHLRARDYAPGIGRFLNRDTWGGDSTTPMSYNAWLYGYDNPVRYIDFSGNKPVDCVPGDEGCSKTGTSIYPSTSNYNEKIPPKGINWITNRNLTLVHLKSAPLFAKDKKDKNKEQLVVKTNAAQFMVKGHEITCTPDPADLNKCIKGTTRNQNFCGQVVLSAIVSLYDKDIKTANVIDNLPGDVNGTGYGDITGYLNRYFGEELYAEIIDSNEKMIETDLRKWITHNIMPMQFVNIVNGSSGNKNGGKVGKSSAEIPHWVLITGVSSNWVYTVKKEVPPWNWVRIFNPFDNEAEYYWWGDFKPAWDQSSGSTFRTALIHPIPKGQ